MIDRRSRMPPMNSIACSPLMRCLPSELRWLSRLSSRTHARFSLVTLTLRHSMISSDLNGDGHPKLIVGYIDAPSVIYDNDGTGRKFDAHSFGDGKGAIYGMPALTSMQTSGSTLVAAWSDAPPLYSLQQTVEMKTL
jgi:hypothetical protein